MNKKQISSLYCFSSNKIGNKHDQGINFSCINSNKKPMSKSLHDDINYFDSSSLQSSNLSSDSAHTLRPKPPPYEEYRATQCGITRSHSTYSACNDSYYCQDIPSAKAEYIDSQDDSLSQYSEGDPPRLTDHLTKLNTSRHCVRPVTLRPVSPFNKKGYRTATTFTKSTVDSQQSPSGDSGVRMTPNEMEQSIRSREVDLHAYLRSSTDVDRLDELNLLRLVNKKLSLNELNNQNLISKATHLIGKLRQKMKDKDFEILNLQNKLKDNTEILRSKERICKKLELEFQQSCQVIDEQCTVSTTMDVSTQTYFPLEKHSYNFDFDTLNQRFEEERANWLEEKARVIGYHKQLNERHQNLLQRNSQLEHELKTLQIKFVSDGDYSSDTCVDSDCGEQSSTLNTDSYVSHSSGQPVSRLVKFEESLC